MPDVSILDKKDNDSNGIEQFVVSALLFAICTVIPGTVLWTNTALEHSRYLTGSADQNLDVFNATLFSTFSFALTSAFVTSYHRSHQTRLIAEQSMRD
jgi:hypothetical protein